MELVMTQSLIEGELSQISFYPLGTSYEVIIDETKGKEKVLFSVDKDPIFKLSQNDFLLMFNVSFGKPSVILVDICFKYNFDMDETDPNQVWIARHENMGEPNQFYIFIGEIQRKILGKNQVYFNSIRKSSAVIPINYLNDLAGMIVDEGTTIPVIPYIDILNVLLEI